MNVESEPLKVSEVRHRYPKFCFLFNKNTTVQLHSVVWNSVGIDAM